MATFILIHGSWHGGWCWEHVVPTLRAAGHEVLAPDLPGMGANVSDLACNPLKTWTDFVTDLVERADDPVILVGHSRGGVVISQVAERVPYKISRLVYVAAFLLRPGESLADVAGRHPETGPAQAIRITDDPTRVAIDGDDGIGIFYNLTDPADAQAAVARLVPEPLAALTTAIKVSDRRFGQVPRAYIETAYDRAVSLRMQREMQAALPCEPVYTLQSDHSPFYSAASELAAILGSLARSDVRPGNVTDLE